MYYYDRLSRSARRDYDIVLKGIMCMAEEVRLSRGYSKRETTDLVYAVNGDHPELFWWNPSIYSYSVGGTTTWYGFKYIDVSRSCIASMAKELTAWKRKITAEVLAHEGRKTPVTAERVRLVGDRIAAGMKYCDTSSVPFAYRHSIWGAYSGKGVCEAIAKAFHFIASENPYLCIRSIYLEGFLCDSPGQLADEPNHAWNAVVDRGIVYHVDFTGRIGKVRIPFMRTFRSVYMKPEDMKGTYVIETDSTSPVYVPPTCTRLT